MVRNIWTVYDAIANSLGNEMAVTFSQLKIESCNVNKECRKLRSIFIEKHKLQSEIVFKCKAIKVQGGIDGAGGNRFSCNTSNANPSG